ncbi:MAG: hypothetical protein K2G05_03155, partial [Duncaniella sp.]|nr:hypothetical protein [Duncaniella sp.]
DDIDNMHRYLMHIAMPITGLRPDGEFDDDGPGIYLRPADDVIDWGATFSFGGVQPYDIYDDDQQQAWDEHWEKVKTALTLPSDLDVTDIGRVDDVDYSTIANDGLYYSLEYHKFYLVSENGMKCSSFDSFPVRDFYTKKEADQLLSGKASLDHTHTDFRALEWQIETLSAKINDNLGGVRIACLCSVYDSSNNKSLVYKLVTCEEWKDLYDSIIAEEVYPIGIWVPIDGHRPVIVAPKVLYGYDYCTFSSKKDSTAFVLDEVSFSNECDAFTDFDRDARRNHAITHYVDKASPNSIAGFAASYNPLKDIKNAPTFNWWLPTLGELMAIFRHLPAIDKCLCALGGYPVVAPTYGIGSSFISSTAYKYQDKDNEHFWCLSLKTGISCVCAYSATPINALLVTSYPTRVLQE